MGSLLASAAGRCARCGHEVRLGQARHRTEAGGIEHDVCPTFRSSPSPASAD